MRAFLKNLEALMISSGLSILISFILNHYTSLVAPYWYISLLFLSIMCLILNLIYTFQVSSKSFTELLLGSLVVKLLLALAGIVVYLSLDKGGFSGFSLQFIIHYILFTIFEIRYLFFLIHSQTLKNTNENKAP